MGTSAGLSSTMNASGYMASKKTGKPFIPNMGGGLMGAVGGLGSLMKGGQGMPQKSTTMPPPKASLFKGAQPNPSYSGFGDPALQARAKKMGVANPGAQGFDPQAYLNFLSGEGLNLATWNQGSAAPNMGTKTVTKWRDPNTGELKDTPGTVFGAPASGWKKVEVQENTGLEWSDPSYKKAHQDTQALWDLWRQKSPGTSTGPSNADVKGKLGAAWMASGGEFAKFAQELLGGGMPEDEKGFKENLKAYLQSEGLEGMPSYEDWMSQLT